MVSDKGVKHRLSVASKPQALARTLVSALMNYEANGICAQQSKQSGWTAALPFHELSDCRWASKL